MNVFMGYNPLATKQAKVTVWVCEQDGETPVAPSNPSEGDCFVVYATDEAVLSNTPTSAKSYSNGEWVDAESGGGGGDSDFTTATLTTINDFGAVLSIPCITYMPEHDMEGSCSVSSLSSNPYTIILYKGKAYFQLDGVKSTSGSIVFDEEKDLYIMTGDCSVEFVSIG